MTDVRVLVVDDAPDIRMLVRYVLGASGHYTIVGEARDGQEAIDRAAETQPDVVLLDLTMPAMDGLEALPQIRIVAPGAAVVILSGLSESIAGNAARAGGAVGYIEKGDLVGSLAQMLDDVLARSAV